MAKSWNIVKHTVNAFLEDRVLTLGAALAYYAMFSIGPLLVIAISVAGLVYSEQGARERLVQQVQSYVGDNAASVLNSMMSAQTKHGSIIATIIGIAGLILGASGIFGQLTQSLNVIWEVQPKPGRGVWGLILDRALDLLMVFGIGLLLLVSMLLTTLISAFSGTLQQWIPIPGFVVQAINLVVALGIVTLLFALVFKLLPDVKIQWHDVWVGAFCTALLFTGGEYLLSLYLGKQGSNSAYGAAGSVVVILTWIYYSALILFFGAEFTRVFAQETGSPIEPNDYAVRVTEEERAQQGRPSTKRVEEHTREQEEEDQAGGPQARS